MTSILAHCGAEKPRRRLRRGSLGRAPARPWGHLFRVPVPAPRAPVGGGDRVAAGPGPRGPDR
eukprot:9600554-Lingulodinium_polyedra.AAC.1